jgi:hypothetical protein
VHGQLPIVETEHRVDNPYRFKRPLHQEQVDARCIRTEEEMLEQGLALIGFSVNQRRRTALAVVTCCRALLALRVHTYPRQLGRVQQRHRASSLDLLFNLLLYSLPGPIPPAKLPRRARGYQVGRVTKRSTRRLCRAVTDDSIVARRLGRAVTDDSIVANLVDARDSSIEG